MARHVRGMVDKEQESVKTKKGEPLNVLTPKKKGGRPKGAKNAPQKGKVKGHRKPKRV